MIAKDCYEFSFLKANGEPLNLGSLKGHVILVVNTASECGFTKQYEELETLYQTFKDQGLQIIAVPSNDFGGQEPGSNQEIQAFCQRDYHLSFPIVAKAEVKGPNAHPFYKWAEQSFGFWATPKWNFHKYLIDKNGKLVDYFISTTSPANRRIVNAIKKLCSA
jgi:glutathione peroxidase